jgi:hypothetical protein
MKTFLRWLSLPVVVILATMFYAGCSDPEDEDNTPKQEGPQGEVNQEQADSFLESFVFNDATKIAGTVPTVANTSLVKTNSADTIYMMRGLRMPIRISHPTGTEIKGWYVTIKNSTSYYDVLIDDEEDTDTVSVLFLEIKPAGGGGGSSGGGGSPSSFPLEITPYDIYGVPIDVLTRILTLEEPASGCDILMDGDTSEVEPSPQWLWHSTAIYDSKGEIKFINAPLREFVATQKPTGCCATAPACPEYKFDPKKNAYSYVFDSEVTAITSYSIYAEVFNFYKNGTFRRYTLESIRNFDPLATDWCKGKPAYNSRESEVEYLGTHDYAPGKASISYLTKTIKCADPLGICGYGSRPGMLTNTCHLMIITVDKLMLEGTKEVRIYEKYDDLSGWED